MMPQPKAKAKAKTTRQNTATTRTWKVSHGFGDALVKAATVFINERRLDFYDEAGNIVASFPADITSYQLWEARKK